MKGSTSIEVMSAKKCDAIVLAIKYIYFTAVTATGQCAVEA